MKPMAFAADAGELWVTRDQLPSEGSDQYAKPFVSGQTVPAPGYFMSDPVATGGAESAGNVPS
jgi:hypothetical protein